MGHGASTQSHSVTDAEAQATGFNWKNTIHQADDASDITNIAQANFEISRIRKIAEQFAPTLKCCRHVAELEGTRKGEVFSGTLEEAREKIRKMRRLLQFVNRIEAVHNIFEKIDKAHSNFITQDEMSNFLKKYSKVLRKETEAEAEGYEMEKDEVMGKRTKGHMMMVDFSSSTWAESKTIFNRADVTYDHKLDFQEFFEYIMTLFHAAFDIISGGKEVIKPERFKKLIAFIYGKNWGIKAPEEYRTKRAKDKTMKKARALKIMELHNDLGRDRDGKGEHAVGRELFVNYLLHCYQDHKSQCSRLYYNLMHMTINDSKWTESMKNAWSDVVKERDMEKADEKIKNIERTVFADDLKDALESEALVAAEAIGTSDDTT